MALCCQRASQFQKPGPRACLPPLCALDAATGPISSSHLRFSAGPWASAPGLLLTSHVLHTRSHSQHTATHAHTDTHLHVFTLTHNIHLHNTFMRSHILTQHTPTQHSYMLTHTTPSHNTQIHTHTQTFSVLFKTSPDRCLGQFLTPQTWFRRSMAVTGDRTGTGAGVWREAVPPPPAGAGVGDPGPRLSADT